MESLKQNNYIILLSVLVILSATLLITITAVPAYAHTPATVFLTEDQNSKTNHSLSIKWNSTTISTKGHYSEIFACGGAKCLPKTTLVLYTNQTKYNFGGLGPDQTWGFKVSECHRTGVLSNQKLCTSSNVIYATTSH